MNLCSSTCTSGPFGRHLFGAERGFFEKNSHRENILLEKFREVFTGNMRALTPGEIRTLVSLRDSGKYIDVLEVPEDSLRAWRVIELNIDENAHLLLGSKERLFPEPRKFFGRVRMPMRPGYTVVSWTISPSAAVEMTKKNMGTGDTIVLVSADLSYQRDKFLLNPEELININDLYSWQKEIWQIAPVEIDQWVVLSSEKRGLEITDEKIIKMIGMIS